MSASTMCTPCLAGTFQATTAGLACQACPANTYSANGASSCLSCPPPQASATDCVRSACQSGVAVDVADDTETPPQDTVTCTTEVCMGGMARSIPNHAACEDGDPCTTNTCTVTGCTTVAIANCLPDGGIDDGGLDAGVADAGSGVDAGLTTDAGVDDAGTMVSDAGAAVDAGTMMADSGTPPVMTDAGTTGEVDAGTDPMTAGGCNCSSMPAPFLWFGLVALAGLRRRKPARR
jgi:uncharacterized protein (TIGR03382 family)